MNKPKIPFSCNWFDVVDDNGHYYISQSDGVAGAVVVAVLNDKLLFLEQSRIATGYTQTLEFPRGSRDEGETPLDCAAREFREEIALDLTPTSFKYLGEVRPDTGLLSSRVAVFCVKASIDESTMDISDESVGFRLAPMADIPNLLRSNAITCGITLAALCLFQASE